MPPQQTPPQNPYEFITNPSQPGNVPKKLPGLNGNSIVKRIALVGGGLVLLLILLIVFKALIFSKSTPLKTELTNIAVEQAELSHLASNSATSSTNQTVLNFSATVNKSVQTAQRGILKIAKNNNVTITTAQLSSFNKQLDNQLTNAVTLGNFDSTYVGLMQQQFTQYQTYLKAAYDKTSDKKLKASFAQDYSDVNLLNTMASSTKQGLN